MMLFLTLKPPNFWLEGMKGGGEEPAVIIIIVLFFCDLRLGG